MLYNLSRCFFGIIFFITRNLVLSNLIINNDQNVIANNNIYIYIYIYRVWHFTVIANATKEFDVNNNHLAIANIYLGDFFFSPAGCPKNILATSFTLFAMNVIVTNTRLLGMIEVVANEVIANINILASIIAWVLTTSDYTLSKKACKNSKTG